jgi:rubrerythrin
MGEFHSVRDIIHFAIRLERASQAFYEQLLCQVDSPAVEHFFVEMVRQERIHEQKLQDILESEDEILPTHEIPSEEIGLYIDAMDVPESMDYKSAVKVAMNKEKASQTLYSILAGTAGNEHYAELFGKLSEQEKAHKQFFETEYRRICISEN